ncbi:hypothetical protein [Pseudoalteromonas sp. MMG005]|uniref:hypothetical protein n=1 Tax=Pseudoalteromonas sp. MMG005 TaxID=2822682 RepID=UPI001B39DF5E|nr:hypothetical protein [Pseudoalteromonas sp. MMG005]MBQ4848329.1 hypothetical protein [Pseudoalteromonas sp. MMG005]
MEIQQQTRFNILVSQCVFAYALLVVGLAILMPILLEMNVGEFIENLIGGGIGFFLVKHIREGDQKMLALAILYFAVQLVNINYGDLSLGLSFGVMISVAFNVDEVSVGINVLSVILTGMTAVAWLKNKPKKY